MGMKMLTRMATHASTMAMAMRAAPHDLSPHTSPNTDGAPTHIGVTANTLQQMAPAAHERNRGDSLSFF
jgi:hypothetical protein